MLIVRLVDDSSSNCALISQTNQEQDCSTQVHRFLMTPANAHPPVVVFLSPASLGTVSEYFKLEDM